MQGSLNFRVLIFLLLDQELILADSLLQSFLFLGEVTLKTHSILIELILGQQVAPDPLIERLNLSLLVSDLLILAVIELKDFHQL